MNLIESMASLWVYLAPPSQQGLKSSAVILAFSSIPSAHGSPSQIGHYLGLHHTFELADEKVFDAFSDTPEEF